MNAALNDIIESVLSIEEFSADDCDYLQEVLTNILASGPEYFESEEQNAQVCHVVY